jgi:integration host factor subunit alpha
MSITRKDLIGMVCNNAGIPKKDCGRLIESAFDIIKVELEKGHDVMISGFGKWSVKKKNARKGRNPKTGEALSINARKVVTFRSSALLRKSLTNKPQDTER